MTHKFTMEDFHARQRAVRERVAAQRQSLQNGADNPLLQSLRQSIGGTSTPGLTSLTGESALPDLSKIPTAANTFRKRITLSRLPGA